MNYSVDFLSHNVQTKHEKDYVENIEKIDFLSHNVQTKQLKAGGGGS